MSVSAHPIIPGALYKVRIKKDGKRRVFAVPAPCSVEAARAVFNRFWEA
jgi:hypothetical protein